jgi:hypothetical protein
MTRSSATLSLFAEPSVSARHPSVFALSIMAHAAVVGLAYFGITHLPQIRDPRLLQRYSVRQLDLHELDPNFPNMPQLAAPEESKIPYPGRDVVEQISGGLTPDMVDAMRAFIGSAAGRQTLVQPAFQSHLSFAEQVPLPTMMIWTRELAPPRRIVPGAPDPPTAANVNPSLQLPNEEIKLADIALAAIDLAPRSEAIPASTTSPLEARSASPAQMASATISPAFEQLTSTSVLSISDLRMPEGMMFLPPVNDVAKSTGSVLAAASRNGGSDPDSSRRGGAPREEVDDIAIDGRRLSTDHIVLPRDGKFSVVVVGSSLAEEYPDTPEIWANRVAYTAYLHVGLNKNWILQYSLTRAADTAGSGRVSRLEAPWPYDIARPNLLSRDLNADALMVHGVLNQAGRLESLAIAFPRSFRYASFVLRALGQWQFRPARQNGQPTAVEVLLIIPEGAD